MKVDEEAKKKGLAERQKISTNENFSGEEVIEEDELWTKVYSDPASCTKGRIS